MTSPSSNNSEDFDHLPDGLTERLEADGALGGISAAAALDLNAEGKYEDGFLVLTDSRLGCFRQQDGWWEGQWLDVKSLQQARIVEGLGVHMLRLLANDKVKAEYRFTLRHAKTVAKLQRQLERQITGAEFDASKAPPPRHHEKKLKCDKCGRAIPAWSEFCPACTSKRKVLFRLLDFVKPYKLRAIAGTSLAILMTLLMLIRPALIEPMLDNGLGTKEGVEPNWPLFLNFLSILAGLIIFNAVWGGIRARLMGGLGSRVARDVRDTVYAHLHKLSLSFFSQKQTGSLVTRVTIDSDRLWDFVAFTVVEAAMAFLTIAGVGVWMFVINWKLAIFVFMPVPLMVGLTIFFHQRMHTAHRRIRHRWGQMTSVIADVLPGVRVIKAFSQEQREIDRFGNKNRQVYDEEMGMITVWTVFGPVMMFCTHIGVLVTWLLGGWWVVQHYQAPPDDPSDAMTVGKLMAFQGYMWMFYRPIHMISHMDRMFTRAAASAQRIFEILDTEPGIFSSSGAIGAKKLKGKIELRNVSFSYDGIRKVLKNINITVAPGEMIGLAGPSGGGKTTLVNLICRFYDVLEGQILIDGVDVRDYQVEEIRRKIGVVLQEPFLFHGTVAQNIAYGYPAASLEQIISSAKAANAHEFIVGFPDGYDTIVGERGQTLSGGERQRISIARAILNNPTILILDEATSSVDTETEKLIQEALDRLVANRTTLAIAHRLSTLRKAHRLVILEKGDLIEEGTHEQLTGKADGVYAKLLRMQAETESIMAI